MVADENCNMQFLHITQYKYNMYFIGLYLNGRLIGIRYQRLYNYAKNFTSVYY